MSKSDAFENALLLLIFNNTNIANIGDATGLRGSVAPGSFHLSLHTADPGEAGSAQTTSECTYTSYARLAVARSVAGFVVTGNSAALAAIQTFANPSNATNLPQTATHFAVGTAASGAGSIIYRGVITPNLVISNTGVTPRLTAGTTITED